MRRRQFLLGSAGAAASFALTGCGAGARGRAPYGGRIVGASDAIGHLLRDGGPPPPSAERRVPVLIVGGGIAGLSAGWKLRKAGFAAFEILELEPEAGGNARSGRNAVSAYPWGAHYVPFPTRESKAVRELFEEIGIIQGYDAAGRPVYDELAVCGAPEERLFINGRWQEGLIPVVGIPRAEIDQFERFKALVASYRERRDRDGRPAFAIPMEYSARDADLLALDRMSMAEFLRQHKLEAPSLRWYVNYCCRDDYGSLAQDVSAWTAMHYFASREGESARPSDTTLLTWPEGVGFIAARLDRMLGAHVRRGVLVWRVNRAGSGAAVDVYDPASKRTTRIMAEDVILACPSTFARYLSPDLPDALRGALAEFEYAPWMVANLTLREFPRARTGVPLAWDNVIYNSRSLGYVAATHQSLQSRPRETVLTYYHALAERPAAGARKALLASGWRDWTDFIMRDLSRPHPEIASITSQIDVMLWGHAMVCPRPGFVWGESRQRVARTGGPIHFAHSDLSGFSIFEEAQYRGVLAAERVLDRQKVRYASSL